MFGRKSRKAQTPAVETVETYSRISTLCAGDPAEAHEVVLERNGMRFGKPTIHRSRWEAERVALSLVLRFPDGYVSVSLVR